MAIAIHNIGNKYAQKYDIDDEQLHNFRKEGLTFTQISKKLGITREIIKYHMNRLGYKKSLPENNPLANYHYKYDINYFQIVDTEDKAYFLGLLYADGCNFQQKGNTHMSCGLHIKDAYLLELFRKYIKNENTLKYPKSQDITILRINGEMISQQLTRLGCYPVKSLTLKFPTEEQVPSHLIHHFIRGYFDGDGCVTKNSSSPNYPCVSFYGTFEFCNSLKEILQDFNITSSIYKHKNIFSLYIFTKDSVKKFYEYIYENAIVKMERKYEKFKQYYK